MPPSTPALDGQMKKDMKQVGRHRREESGSRNNLENMVWDVVGLQEGRSRYDGVVSVAPYHMIRAKATPHGDYGAEVWIHERLLPDPANVIIVESTPRVLLVVLPWKVRVYVCSAHAPCGPTATEEHIAEWWSKFRALLRKSTPKAAPLLLMIDTNKHLEINNEESDDLTLHTRCGAHALADILDDFCLRCPPFEAEGQPAPTFFGPRSSERTLGFVAAPIAWKGDSYAVCDDLL